MINIILCTYNSNKSYLYQQLDSIFSQSYKIFKIYIFDDSHDDVARKVYKYFKKKFPNKIFYSIGAKENSFSANFLHGLKKIKINQSQKNYFMFCDQDDIWGFDKLETYIKKLSIYKKKLDKNSPFLIGGRTTYINEINEILVRSEKFKRKPSLENALVQSIFGGNTIFFNIHLFNILNSLDDVFVYSHDWWCYIVNEIYGGKTVYLNDTKTFYRQHSDSIIGGNIGIKQKLIRTKKFIYGDYRNWNNMHCNVFQKNLNKLPTNTKSIIQNYIFFRKHNNFKSKKIFFKLRLYRQSKIGTLIYFFGSFFKRI